METSVFSCTYVNDLAFPFMCTISFLIVSMNVDLNRNLETNPTNIGH